MSFGYSVWMDTPICNVQYPPSSVCRLLPASQHSASKGPRRFEPFPACPKGSFLAKTSPALSLFCGQNTSSRFVGSQPRFLLWKWNQNYNKGVDACRANLLDRSTTGFMCCVQDLSETFLVFFFLNVSCTKELENAQPHKYLKVKQQQLTEKSVALPSNAEVEIQLWNSQFTRNSTLFCLVALSPGVNTDHVSVSYSCPLAFSLCSTSVTVPKPTFRLQWRNCEVIWCTKVLVAFQEKV